MSDSTKALASSDKSLNAFSAFSTASRLSMLKFPSSGRMAISPITTSAAYWSGFDATVTTISLLCGVPFPAVSFTVTVQVSPSFNTTA
jgi:hypothetical protein